MVQVPQFNVFSAQQAAAGAERVKAARLQNEVAGMQASELRRKEQSLERIRQMRTQFENGGEIVAALRAEGQHDAADQFIRTQQQNQLMKVKMLSQFGPLVRDEETYETVRSQLVRSGAVEEDFLPVRYDESFYARQMKKEELKLKEFNRKVGVKGGITQEQQVILDQFGREHHRGPVRPSLEERKLSFQQRKERARQAERDIGGKVPTAVSNAIGRRVATFFGGNFNIETGKFEIAGESNRRKAVRIGALAERYAEQGVAPLQAVERALADTNEGAVGPPAQTQEKALIDVLRSRRAR